MIVWMKFQLVRACSMRADGVKIESGSMKAHIQKKDILHMQITLYWKVLQGEVTHDDDKQIKTSINTRRKQSLPKACL